MPCSKCANYISLFSSRPESEFIEDIVGTINCKLNLRLVSAPTHLTPIETQAKYINSWLDNEEPGDDVFLICGMGGGGKTTLAQYIYNANKQKFESSSFLLDIGLEHKQPYGLRNLKIQLMSDILGINSSMIHLNNEYGGTTKIVEALCVSRILIVLDDIENEKELDVLLGPSHYGTKSKIIITTRSKDIQSWFKSKSRKCNVYELKLLNVQESVKLLCGHAFGSSYPMEGFEDLAVDYAEYCEGNPLALKVLGSSLFSTDEEMQKRNDIIGRWKSNFILLISAKGNVDSKILSVLKRSYDTLPYDTVKDLFLHIACFFVGEYEDYVTTILEPEWHAKSGITTLINRCLLSISPGNKLIMHQLLQDMAKNIVKDESTDLRKHSRVWHESESHELLSNSEPSETIKGLALDTRKFHSRWSTEKLKTSSLLKLKKLKLLRLINVEFEGNYDSFPQLRWLCWHNCNLKKIPRGLFMGSLVALDMSNGKCEKFESPVVLDYLKILNLKGSHKLRSINKLDRFPNLESLILWDCGSLVNICETIGSLQKLALLDLTGCKKLWVEGKCSCFDGEKKKLLSFSLPASLEFLFLNNFFPEGNVDVPELKSDQSQQLRYVNLGNSMFKSLPRNIDNVIRVLDLTCCPILESLIGLPSTIEELYTYRCTSLKKIIFQSARFKLRKFGYGGCTKLSEIQGLFKLVPIKELSEADLGEMKWIKRYQDYEMKLVGDEITTRRIWPIQMLYEYGIRSTFMGVINDQNMDRPRTNSPFMSFRLELPSAWPRIDGYLLTSFYKSTDEVADMPALFAIIRNKTKSRTWIYNPVVFGKPRRGEEAVWLSYWPNRNMIEVGDEVHVSIIGLNGLMVTGVTSSSVYGLPAQTYQANYTKEEEVIGGDLSEFELTKGVYYLCRRDFFKSTASYSWLKELIGDTFDYTELHGWRKARQTFDDESFMELQTFRGNHCRVNEITEYKEPIHERLEQ